MWCFGSRLPDMGGFGLADAHGKFTSAPPARRRVRDRRFRVLVVVCVALPLLITIPYIEAALGSWAVFGVVIPYASATVLWHLSRTTAKSFVVDAEGITTETARHPWAEITEVRVDGEKLYADVKGKKLELCRLPWVQPGPAELFAAIERHSAGRFRLL